MTGLYKEGDYVIRRSGGVWLVIYAADGIYSLREYESGKCDSSPFDGEDIIRLIADKEKILDAISRVGFITVINVPNEKIRKELYEDAMREYDEIEWIKVIKSAYLRKHNGRLFEGEASLAEQAKRYFHCEISIVLGIPVSGVEAYISNAVSEDKW